jgi:hypothetical protein
MISLMQISTTAHGLVLSYPLWTSFAFGAIALAAAAYAVACRARIRRRWPVSLAILIAAWAAIYAGTFKATITDDAGSAYAFLRYSHSVRWQDAADIYLERRGNGNDWQIVVIDRERRAYRFDVAELSIPDRDRVMAYMVDRMPANAFRPAPELLKRHASPGARPASFFGDQQI